LAFARTDTNQDIASPTGIISGKDGQNPIDNASLANPASTYCLNNGGELELITNDDDSQIGMCNLGEFACEEWVFIRGECGIDDDSQKIYEALQAKGLDLTGMEVKINKHLGNYIEGSVVPVSTPGGGGYVFAAKEGDMVKIVADGNGAIMCSYLEDYPDYPSYLIPECINSSGNTVTR